MKHEKQKPGSAFQRAFVAVLGGERTQSIAIPLFTILCSLIAAAVVILLVGRNPVSAFYSLLQGAGVLPKATYAAHKGLLTDFMSMLGSLTPMLFAALGVAVAYKAGLFNIGVSGQMLFAGFMATVLVGYSELPGIVAKPLVIIIGAVCGALAGALLGFLKYRFNINEVVSSIMLNYILQYIISFFINTNYVDTVTRQSKAIRSPARLMLTNVEVGGLKIELPICIVLAVLCAFLIRFLLDRTRIGYEIKTVGANPGAAAYAGMRVGRNIVLAMTISGALAGLAGVSNYLGYFTTIPPKVLTSIGFDSIAVSLLGNSNPIGIIFSSLLITVISKGSTYMSSSMGLQQEIASVITGLILLFSACSAFVLYLVERAKQRLRELEAAGGAHREEGEERV